MRLTGEDNDIGYGRYLIMNENKNKVINYAQDFGALIALILLVAGISIASKFPHRGQFPVPAAPVFH